MIPTRIVVHIGYHKTGTTALQRRYFPSLPGITFLTHGGRAAREHPGEKALFLGMTGNLHNAPDEGFWPETIAAFFAETRERSPGPVVVSHENLSGAIFDGSFNQERNARRLHAVLPDADILVVVREQRSMLRSVYAQHVRRGGYASFSDFVLGTSPDSDFDLDHLRYDRLVALYRELFGPDHVLVLPYEWLKTDPVRFLSEVNRYIDPTLLGHGVDTQLRTVGRSLSPVSRWITRRTNRAFVPSAINPRPLLFPLRKANAIPEMLQRVVDPRLFEHTSRGLSDHDEALIEVVVARYEHGNRRLQEMVGLPLDELGYPTAPADAGGPPGPGPGRRPVPPAPPVARPARSGAAEAVVYPGFANPLSASLLGRLFPSIPATRYLKGAGRRPDPMYGIVRSGLLADAEDRFMPRTSRAWLRETSAGFDRLLIADEGLGGDLLSGGQTHARSAARLHRILPDARILLVIRRQDEMVRSLFDLYIRRGGTGSLAQLLANEVAGCAVDLDAFRYDELVRMYQATFGADRVAVVPYETFECDPRAFIAKVADAVGTTPTVDPDDLVTNDRRSARGRAALRALNRTFRHSALDPEARFPEPAPIRRTRDLVARVDRRISAGSSGRLDPDDERLVRDVVDRYASGNAALADLVGVDLAALGYPVATRSAPSPQPGREGSRQFDDASPSGETSSS